MFLSVCLSVRLSVCLFEHMYVCLSVSLFVCLCVCNWNPITDYLPIFEVMFSFVCLLSFRLFVYMSVCPFFCSSVCLSTTTNNGFFATSWSNILSIFLTVCKFYACLSVYMHFNIMYIFFLFICRYVSLSFCLSVYSCVNRWFVIFFCFCLLFFCSVVVVYQEDMCLLLLVWLSVCVSFLHQLDYKLYLFAIWNSLFFIFVIL